MTEQFWKCIGKIDNGGSLREYLKGIPPEESQIIVNLTNEEGMPALIRALLKHDKSWKMDLLLDFGADGRVAVDYIKERISTGSEEESLIWYNRLRRFLINISRGQHKNQEYVPLAVEYFNKHPYTQTPFVLNRSRDERPAAQRKDNQKTCGNGSE